MIAPPPPPDTSPDTTDAFSPWLRAIVGDAAIGVLPTLMAHLFGKRLSEAPMTFSPRVVHYLLTLLTDRLLEAEAERDRLKARRDDLERSEREILLDNKRLTEENAQLREQTVVLSAKVDTLREEARRTQGRERIVRGRGGSVR